VESAFRQRSGVLIGGRYRLHEQLGADDRSPVWRAADEAQGRIVAVRRVAVFGTPAEAASVRDRILLEARAVGSGHPHIVPIFDVVVEAGELWVTKEYVPARTLAGVLAERGPLPAGEVAAIGAQVASALAAAHAAGVVHRDVNPHNILVAWPFVRLDDFGVTPSEATPVVDPRNDVHALGGALYAAIGGHRGAPRAGPLMWVLAGLTAADPAARPTAAQAEVMLRDVAGRAGSTPERSRRRRLALGLGLVVWLVAVVITTGAAVLAVAPGEDSDRAPAISVAPSSAPTVPVIGDPRTADPCALVDEPALRQHGLTDVEPYAGAMTSCWAYVAVRQATEVAVSLELMPAAFMPEQSGGERDERGPLTLVRYAFDGSYCTRRINLPDSNVVHVAADGRSGVDPETICAVADTAADGAVARLLAAGVTARPIRVDTTVLAGRDACQLLTVGDLRALPGTAPTPVRGLADWSCRWGDWAGPSVTVTFWRGDDEPGDEETPIDVAGRPSTLYRSPDDGGCVVTFPQQRFDGHVESVSVYVYDRRAGVDTCGAATAIAGAAAAKLPPPS
jgi:hypothetical protein